MKGVLAQAREVDVPRDYAGAQVIMVRFFEMQVECYETEVEFCAGVMDVFLEWEVEVRRVRAE